MKKSFCGIFLFWICISISFGQNCIPGTIVFSSQAQVNAFPSNYPGCTIIDGNVGVTGSVQNLDSLIQLTKINGGLQILDANNITDLDGLNSLVSIGGNLNIISLYFSDLSAFSNLDFIGGDFKYESGTIETFSGFGDLDTIGGSLFIQSDLTTNLNGFSSLSYVGSNIYVYKISSLGNINNLDTVRGNLSIFYATMNNLQFPNLKSIEGSLNVNSNENLNNVSGFNQLNYVGEGISFTYNNVLTDISGFSTLNSPIDFLFIISNPFLNNIAAFDEIPSLGYAQITDCPFLTDCNISPLCSLAFNDPNDFYIQSNGNGCASIQQIIASCPPLPDADNDGVPDINDNCINTPNPNQEDNDNDDIGNACDPDYDQDGDGITNQNDNCDLIANPNQEDANNDGEGNVCDSNSDSDIDGIMDANDNCVTTSNSTQEDTTNNGIGDACEDTDFDGIMDDVDNCIYTSNPNQEDVDNDDIGDVCEPSATCGSGLILINSQSLADNFKNVYPGCTTIEGSLILAGSITNVDSLNDIQVINGNIQSQNTYNLNSLSGFDNLTHVFGSILLQDININNINYFHNLQKVGGKLKVYANNTITGQIGFETLDTIGSDFFLSGNHNQMDGFEDLKFIGGNLSYYNNSPALNFSGFNSVTSINGSITISNNNGFINYSGFNQLQRVGGLALHNIGNLTGFVNLDTIVGYLDLSGQGNINGFSELQYIGSDIYLKGLNNIGVINQLVLIKGDLYISNITSNASINFPNLTSIDGALRLYQNTFQSMNGFNSLIKVRSIDITENSLLQQINGFINLDTIELSLSLNDNPYLYNISGFNHDIHFINPYYNNSIININVNPLLSICDIEPICNALSTMENVNIGNNANGCSSIQEIQQSCPPIPDSDGDTLNDLLDNCPNTPNPNQADANNDGEGNACDSNSDTDNDGSVDSIDNCVTTFNPNQADANNDGEGDKCDNNSDSDSDDKNDNIDNCPPIFNPDQRDCNNNGIGDVCEGYVDNDCDAIANASDNCPDLYNPYQIDYNNNSIGDACENFPKVGFNTTQPKTEMHLSYSNLYLDHPEKGLIVKDHNGNCFKTTVETVSGQSQLKLVAITCP